MHNRPSPFWLIYSLVGVIFTAFWTSMAIAEQRPVLVMIDLATMLGHLVFMILFVREVIRGSE